MHSEKNKSLSIQNQEVGTTELLTPFSIFFYTVIKMAGGKMLLKAAVHCNEMRNRLEEHGIVRTAGWYEHRM